MAKKITLEWKGLSPQTVVPLWPVDDDGGDDGGFNVKKKVKAPLPTRTHLKRSRDALSVDTSFDTNDESEWIATFETPIRPRVGDRLPSGEFCDEDEYQRRKKRQRLESTLSTKLLVERTENMIALMDKWPNLFHYPRGEVGVRIDIFYIFAYETALAQCLVVSHALSRLLGFMSFKDDAARSHKQSLERLTIDVGYPESSSTLNVIVMRFNDVAEYVSSSLRTGRFTTDQYLLHATMGLDTLHGTLVSMTSLTPHTNQGHILRTRV